MTKRNILVFLRDRAAVFFSVLSMLIVLGLMVVFLGDMNSRELVGMLAELGGERNTAQDEENAAYLIQMWTLAGILVVNAVTVTLTVMGTMVEDESQKRLASFYAAPVKRGKVTIGYVAAAWIIGIFMCVLTFIAGEGYMVLCGRPLLVGVDCLKILGMIVLNVFVYASIAYLLAMCIRSTSAWSGMLTIVGTLVGFAGGIYLPMSMLPQGVVKVMKCLPVLHGAGMMREVCTRAAIEQTFAGLPKIAGEMFRKQMGISISMENGIAGVAYQITFLAACGIIAILAGMLISRRRKLRDR